MPLAALRRRLIAGSLLGLLIATILFLTFPGIDLWISDLFASDTGFPIAHEAFWKHVRAFFIWTTDGTMLLLLAVLFYNWLRPRHVIGKQREIGFALLAYLLGPGLIVNGILKAFWGRARPRDVLNYGGLRHFTPPVLPAAECSRNCSFVSGEASSAATLALVALLLFWPRLDRKGRIAAVITAPIYVAGASVLRIAFGGHFASDTIFAVLLMGVMVPLLHIVVLDRSRAQNAKITMADR